MCRAEHFFLGLRWVSAVHTTICIYNIHVNITVIIVTLGSRTRHSAFTDILKMHISA